MKKIILTSFLSIINLVIFAQIPVLTFEWINNFENTITCYDLKNDNSGNTFVCGSFSGSLTLADTIISSVDTNTSEIFLAKLDTAGNILWFRFAEGYGIDKAYSLALDTINSFVYISGSFFQKVRFENDTLFPHNGFNHFFLVKYDFDGNYQWSRFARRAAQMGTPSTIALDNNQDIILVTEQGSDSIVFEDTTLATSIYDGLFLAKYSKYGSRLLTKLLTENDIAFINKRNLVIDNNNNIFIYSTWGNPISIDTLQPMPIRIIKYNNSGVYQWAFVYGESFYYDYSHANTLTIDNSNNIYVTGEYFIDQGVTTSFFMFKISGDGILIWDRQIPYSYTTPAYSTGLSILTLNDTSVFVTLNIDPMDYLVNFFGTIVFNNGLYLAQFDSSGNLKMIKSYQNNNITQSSEIVFSIDRNENFYFGSGKISKVKRDILLKEKIITKGANKQIMVYPNPADNYIEISLSPSTENFVIEIFNIYGQQEIICTEQSNEIVKINIKNFQQGLYLVRITDIISKVVYQDKFVKY